MFTNKDIKHMERDFCSDAWVMGGTWGHGHLAYQIEEDVEKNRIQVKNLP